MKIRLTRFKIILWDVLSMDYDEGIHPRQVVRNVEANYEFVPLPG